ncbi:MAG: VWA domain-containing protein, partial [Thermoguttaceae bacterium]
MINFSLQQGSSIAVMCIVAAAAALLSGFFYRRVFSTLGTRRWLALFALRAGAILLVVLLIFRPTYTYQKQLHTRPALVFLVDSSASMSIADDAGGTTRFESARAQIEKWRHNLGKDFDPRLMVFAESAHPLKHIQELDGLIPDGKSTSIGRALSAAAQLVPRENLAAVILFSDGINNSAQNPVELCAKLGVVVHAVGLGSSLRSNAAYRDVQVTAIGCPDRLFFNNLAWISATIAGINLHGRVVHAALDEDGREIASKELTIESSTNSQEVFFDFRPAAKGKHTYTIRVSPVDEEKIVQNNQRSASTLVVQPRIKVLYIEGTLRAEYGALVDRFLGKDPDLEFYALVQTRPNVFLRRTNMADMNFTFIPDDAETVNKFDVFIIGDIDSTYFKPQIQRLFVQRVRDGAGVIMLGGYHSLGPGGYSGTFLGE